LHVAYPLPPPLWHQITSLSESEYALKELQRALNAWCELPVQNLSGRCPHSRVGLPPNPQGKGTDPSCSMWTPSSLHSTLWWTTSASPTLQKGSQDHTHVSVRARSSPSPCSPAGRGSPARGTSTATPRPTSQMPSPLFPSVPSSIGWCAPHTELIEAFFLHLVALLEVRKRPYEALDSSAMPTRDCKRRGHGWLAGQADIGWFNSLGWYL
jgi:hypothetical protein